MDFWVILIAAGFNVAGAIFNVLTSRSLSRLRLALGRMMDGLLPHTADWRRPTSGPARMIPPGRAPRLLVAQAHDRADRLVDEEVIERAPDSVIVAELIARYGTDVRIRAVYLYDGDTGESYAELRLT